MRDDRIIFIVDDRSRSISNAAVAVMRRELDVIVAAESMVDSGKNTMIARQKRDWELRDKRRGRR